MPLLCAFLLGGLSTLSAQAPGTGTIAGRIFNPGANAYVANAEIRVVGTDLSAVSDSGGNYTIFNVPAGQVTVAVSYIGYDPVRAPLVVTVGETAPKDFDLVSTSIVRSDKGEDIIMMQAFSVTSEREGNAKAVMAQRNSMNITNSVSSDVFGDVAEGNVGEFLKFLPGVDLEYVEADTRAPKIRGLDAQYTGVTLNGMKMASADAFIQYNGTDNSRAGAGNRSLGFEQVSINSIESIEVNLTSSADMDANAPAGTINLKTKRAFDRKGRFVSWQANVMGNSEDLTLSKTYGPSDKRAYKIRPGGIFEFADVFCNNRLGIIATISESNMYNQQRLTQLGYNATTTATDPRPYVLSSLMFKSGPKFTERFSTTLNADYKASSRLTLSLLSSYNWYHAEYFNRQLTFSGTRANATGDGMTDFDFTNVTLASAGAQAVKLGRTITLTPSFEYKWRSLTVDGAFTASKSVSSYGAFTRGTIRDVTVANLTGLAVHVQRSAMTDPDFQLVQTAGPDFGDLSSYKNPRVGDDGRFAEEKVYQGQVNAKLVMPWRLPTWFKTGIKITELYHHYENTTPMLVSTYVGPGGGTTGSFGGFDSPTAFDMGRGTTLTSLSGKLPAMADRRALAELTQSHPEYFARTYTTQNFYDAYIGARRFIREQFNAGYLMGGSKYKNLQVQTGLRWEESITQTKEFDRLPSATVKAAGYAVDATGRASTPEGLVYQYMSRPQIDREGSYDNFFPSASLKYSFTPDLQAQVGYSHTISRPAFNDIGGVWTYDDTNLTVNVPNPNLKPEKSDNVSARLAYYFEPVGNLAVGVYQNNITNSVTTRTYTAQEFGYGDDPEYGTYTFYSRDNAGSMRRWRGLTIDYRQTLSFLPRALKSTTVFANYTRNVTDMTRPGVAPHMISSGISTRLNKFNIGVNAKWTDDTPYGFVAGRYRKHRIMTDLNMGYQFSRKLTVSLQIRNLANTPDYIYDNYLKSNIFKFEHYGSIYTLGVRGTF